MFDGYAGLVLMGVALLAAVPFVVIKGFIEDRANRAARVRDISEWEMGHLERRSQWQKDRRITGINGSTGARGRYKMAIKPQAK